MTQGAFDFGRHDRVERWHREMLRALQDSVDAAGLYTCAGACDAGKADLRHALNEREGRHMRTSWAIAIADVAPIELGLRIAAPLAAAVGHALVPEKTLRPEDEVKVLRAALRGLGPVGVQALRDALGGRAPP